MDEVACFRRRDLPHIDVQGKPTFITACLKGSLPAAGLKRIRNYRDELNAKSPPQKISAVEWEIKKHKLVFKLVDSLLDGDCPVTHLKDERLAKIVQDAFLFFAHERYRLYAFVIMPSHHHWVFLPNEKWAEWLQSKEATKENPRRPREVISHSIQSFTATMCNRVLGQTGPFWQTETFDHYARDESELLRIIHYIENNPVAAGLASRADEYYWSSARLRKVLGVGYGQAITKVT